MSYIVTSETRLGCGTKSMLTYPAAEIIKLFEIICNNDLIAKWQTKAEKVGEISRGDF